MCIDLNSTYKIVDSEVTVVSLIAQIVSSISMVIPGFNYARS